LHGRQDANAAFAPHVFLYGGNADYIEDLYARYENDPKASMPNGRHSFQSLKDDRTDVLQERPRAVVVAAALAGSLHAATHFRPRRRLARGRKGGRRQGEARAQATGSSFLPPRSSRPRADSIHALMLIRAYRGARALLRQSRPALASSRTITREDP